MNRLVLLSALVCLLPSALAAQSVVPNSTATTMVVVRDATTGQVDMIVIPDHDGELDDPNGLGRTIAAVPNAVVDRVPVAQVNKNGLAAALAVVDPQAILSAPQANLVASQPVLQAGP